MLVNSIHLIRFCQVFLISEQFYSLPEDDDYDLVKNEKWSEERRKEVLGRLDEIYELAEAQFMLAKGLLQTNCFFHE